MRDEEYLSCRQDGDYLVENTGYAAPRDVLPQGANWRRR
jgi:hypothetical protein